MTKNFKFNFIKNEFYPKSRNGAAIWKVDERYLYLFGGSENENIYNDFLKYDIIKNKWDYIKFSTTDDVPEPRFGSIHFLYLNKLCLISGFSKDNQTYNDFWMFNLNSKKWHKIDDFPLNSLMGAYSSYWLKDNILYYTGGVIIKNKILTSNDKLMSYNINTNKIECISDHIMIPKFSSNFWKIKIKDTEYLYLLDGLSFENNNEVKQIKDFSRFNLKTKKWEKLDIMNNKYKPRNSSLLWELDGLVYLLGGINKDNYIFNELWEFNPVKNNFNKINLEDMITSRSDSALWKIDNEIFILGGLGEEYHINDFWKLKITNKYKFCCF